jgi:predicted LPLAT superfamily acyltransferase
MSDHGVSMPGPVGWRDRPEAGTVLGIRFMMALARLLGRRLLHATLYPITGYFYLVRRHERRCSRDFLTRVLGRPVRRRDVFRHFLSFARATADRVYFLDEQHPPIAVTFHGAEALQALVDEAAPGVFLAAHMGSFEAARVLGPALGGVDLHIVLDRQVNPRIMRALEAVNPAFAELIIDSEQGAAKLGLAIAAALERGHWVGFLADRHRPQDRTVECRFLGGRAEFPVGPFVIASTFKAPVVGIFPRCVAGGYEIHCEILSRRMDIPRAGRQAELAAWAQAYADRLAHHARAAPFSWFNFFDFWLP